MTYMGFSIFWYGPSLVGCNFIVIPYRILKFGFITNVPIQV